MKLLVRKFLCLSLVLSAVSACQSGPDAGVRYSGQTSRFYAPNRTPTVSDEFRSDADLERAVNQSFKNSQKSRNTLTESQLLDTSKQISSKQNVSTYFTPARASYTTSNNAAQANKQTYTPAAGQYYIQAGCYSREEVALSQVAKLKANGINNVYVMNEGGISKVRVGPYATKESGISVLNKMKNQLGFVDSFWKY